MRISLIAVIVTLLSSTVQGAGNYVTYRFNSKPYEGYMIIKEEKAPFILLIHDWDGLTGYEVKRAEMLAEEGYSVFAIDLFGKGERPETVEDKRQHTGELYKDREKMRGIMYSALEYARNNGANTENAVAMGYCFGGAAVLELARSGAGLKGYVTFHGGLATPEGQDYSKTEGELFIMHGTADSNITMDDFTSLAKELEAAGVKNRMLTFGGARHAFTVFESSRYNEFADKISWRYFTDYLNRLNKPAK